MSINASEPIQSIEPYKPGKPLEELERELGIKDAIKLASNENPLGPSRKALAALKKGLTALHRYPEGTGRILREALAEKNKVSSDEIILGNGSDEIMDLTAKTYLSPGDEAVVGDRTFSIYSICIKAHRGVVVQVPLCEGRHDLDAILRSLTSRTRLVFICNPNNPTGTAVTHRDLEGFLKQIPEEVLVIVDEAYGEYATDPYFPDTESLLRNGSPLIVLRTFSKFYGLAGLRVGYGISQANVIEDLNRVRLPFNTNTLAQIAALAALGDESHGNRCLKVNQVGKKYLYGAFDRLGLKYLPTQANFVFFDVGRDAQFVYEALLRKGVIVRPIEGAWIRVSIGLQKENRRFVDSLEKTLNTGSSSRTAS